MNEVVVIVIWKLDFRSILSPAEETTASSFEKNNRLVRFLDKHSLASLRIAGYHNMVINLIIYRGPGDWERL
jgi:hypothetical protein